ncbi:MAG: hypothetical protein L6Q98_04145 [Anaerolineae bacterium]|nr:hypothetical protein [Anaerolineae bacterium]NUQ07200.1 hypothetical protein [Anaerolineae bacterium]
MLVKLLRYFFRSKQRLNHGGRLISPYLLSRASEDEKLLMLAGVARSPEDARFLLAKYNTSRAGEVLKRVKRHKRHTTPGERLIAMARRLEGHDPRGAGGKAEDDRTVEWRRRYRRPEW